MKRLILFLGMVSSALAVERIFDASRMFHNLLIGTQGWVGKVRE